MRAAIYCRVSTEDQEREGTSLQSQLEACWKLAIEKGYEVSDDYVFQEVWSGADMDRPGLNRFRDLIRAKEADAAICYSTDRLARNPIHIAIIAEECEKRGIGLIFVTEPLDNSPEGQLIRYVRGYAAQIEREKIRERTIRGKRARALSGKLPGSSHARLYGYYYIPGKGIGEGVRYINEDEAKWVREIFRWLVEEGLSTNAVTYRLRALGVPTPSGKGYWIKRTVQKMMRNPAYCGKTYAFTVTYGEPKRRVKPGAKRQKTGVIWRPREEWLEIPNATPPIISEELFEAAQRQLQRNKELSLRNTKNQYLLHGHIYCRRCGRSYWASSGIKTRSGHRYSYPYYGCSGNLKIVSPVKCGNRRVSANAIEAIVWEQIEALLAKPDLVMAELHRRQQEAKEVSSVERVLDRLEAQLANREKQKARMWKAFELTGDEEAFKASIAQLGEEVRALQQEKSQLEKRIEASNQFELSVEDMRGACELVRRNLKGLSFEDKRLALEALQVKVWIDGDNVAIEGAIPLLAENIESLQSGRHRPAPRPGS